MGCIPVEPHLDVRPIRSTGDQCSQLLNCFLHSGNPGLIGVYPYHRETIHPVSCCPLLSRDQEEGNVTAELFCVPEAFRLVREESSD